MSDEFDIESHLSDRSIEYAESHIGKDIQVGAIVVPPVPRDKVEETLDDYDGVPDDADSIHHPIKGHLYDLTDLSLAINHAGDPMLDHSAGEEDDNKYNVTHDSLAEIKIARGALFAAYNRELAALADRLGLDSEQDDLVRAIRGELGYSVDVSVSDNLDTASKKDLDDALDLDDE